MSFPQPNRKFSDARDLNQLATMLDDYFLLLTRDIGLRYSNALLPQTGKALVGMQVGTLVQANANATLKRADNTLIYAGTSYFVRATSVVIDVLQNNTVIYSPFAIVNVSLADGRGDGFRPLYLGRNGNMQVTRPDTSILQEVGMILNYDGQTNTYKCLIMPMFGVEGEVTPIVPIEGFTSGSAFERIPFFPGIPQFFN